MKTLYNSTALECALELLYRTRGVRIDPDFATITLESVNATQARLVIVAKTNADDGRRGIYTGTTYFPFERKQILDLLPTFLIYSSVYPTTFQNLRTNLRGTYDFLLEEGEFALQGVAGDVPLTNASELGVQLDSDRQIYLRVLSSSGRWVPGQLLPIRVGNSADDSYPTLAAWGDAPNAILGQDYTFRYSASGGRPDYTWTVVSGVAPAELGSDGQFFGPVLHTGDLEWVVRCRDSRGFFVDISDSARVDVADLLIHGEFPTDLIVGQEFEIEFTGEGGQGPYRFDIVVGQSADFTLSETGVFNGQLDGGAHVIDMRIRDVLDRATVRRFEFNVQARTTLQIAQSLLAKMLSWYTFDEGTFNNAALVLDLHSAANMAVIGAAEGLIGRRGIAVRLNGGRIQGVTSAHDVDRAFSFAMATRDLAGDSARYLLSKWATNAGWSVLTTDDGSGKVRLDYVAEGQGYSFISQGEAFDGEWRHLIVDRADGLYENQVQFFIDNQLNGRYPTTRAPVDLNNQRNTAIGARADNALGTNFTGDLDEMGVFSDRLWSDERAYLYNNNALRSYWQIREDAGLLTRTTAPTFAGAAPDSAVGLHLEHDYVISGGRLPYTNPRVVGGAIPSGLTLSLVGGNRVRLTGQLTTEQECQYTLALNDADGRPATLFDTINVAGVQGKPAIWNRGDMALGLVVDDTDTEATTTLNGPAGQRGIVRSSIHVAVPCIFELDIDPGNGTGDAAFGGVVDGRWNTGQLMAAGTSGIHVAMPSRNVYHNGALIGQLGGESTRVVWAVNPTNRRVWLRAEDMSTWFQGGSPAAGTSPACTLGGSNQILAAAEPYRPGQGKVTLYAIPAVVATPPAGFERGLLEHSQTLSLLHLNEAPGATAFNDVYPVDWTASGGGSIVASAEHFDGLALQLNVGVQYLESALAAINLTTGPFAVEFFIHSPNVPNINQAIPLLQYGIGANGLDGFALTMRRPNDVSVNYTLRNAAANQESLAVALASRHHVLIARCNDGYLRMCLDGTVWTGPLRQINGASDPTTFLQGMLRLGVVNEAGLQNRNVTFSELRVTLGSTVYPYGAPFTVPAQRYTE